MHQPAEYSRLPLPLSQFWISEFIRIFFTHKIARNETKSIMHKPTKINVKVNILQYSQSPQLGHVVEAGQWNKSDVVVVESARKKWRV